MREPSWATIVRELPAATITEFFQLERIVFVEGETGHG